MFEISPMRAEDLLFLRNISSECITKSNTSLIYIRKYFYEELRFINASGFAPAEELNNSFDLRALKLMDVRTVGHFTG